MKNQERLFAVVTEEDIRGGRRKYTSSCPIALACKMTLGDEVDVIVGPKTIYVRPSVSVDEIYTPFNRRPLRENEIDFIAKFDAGEEVKPGLVVDLGFAISEESVRQ